MFLIFKEANNNIIKHADCTKVDITLVRKGIQLVLEIKDNGKGFDVKIREQGNGLSNMQHRADKLKVTLMVNSTIS